MTKNEITAFDFGDGRGPVPAHQHLNGGGWVDDQAFVDETVYVHELAIIIGFARVYSRASISYGASIGDGASIDKEDQWVSICNVGSRRSLLTAVQKPDKTVHVWTGCFSDKSLLQFVAAVKAKHGTNVYGQEYKALVVFVRAYFKAHESKEGEK